MAQPSHINIPQSNTKGHKMYLTFYILAFRPTRYAGQVAISWHDGHRLPYQAKPYRLNIDPR